MILYLTRYFLEFQFTKLMPVKIVQRMQVNKANNLIRFALEQSDFYKSIYQDIPREDLIIKNLEDLQKLPIIDKEKLKAFETNQILTNKEESLLIKRSTSGSTGKPFDTYLSKKEYFTSYFRTFFSLKNYNPFQAFGLIGVYKQKEEIEKGSFLSLAQKYLGLFRREAFSVFSPMDEIVGKLRAKNIKVLSATPSCLKVLIEELKKNNESLQISYVVVFGETLFEDLKVEIKNFLNAKIINVYGCMEHPSLAWTEPDGESFNYAANSIILEYVNPVEINGEVYGELVITNLVNKTMPFIRYKVGDHVKLLKDHLKMGKIIGRVEDIITLNNGKQIFRLQVWSLFRGLTECQQYKILQKKNKEIFFQVVVKHKGEENIVQQKIKKIWDENFGSVPIFIEFKDTLPLNEKTGKFMNIEIEK